MITLYGKDSKGNLRIWMAYAEEDEVVVKHGKYNGKLTEKRYTAEHKNVGKANETTPKQQAIIEVEAKVVKQLKAGYYYDKDEALNHVEFTPMKAHNYDTYSYKISFPCYMQKKYNGLRLLIDKNGQAWSKQGEPLDLPSHWIGIKEYAIARGGLDGEVYAGLESNGGLSLQKINSAFTKPNENTPKLKFYVYDIPSDANQWERTDALNTSRKTEALPESLIVVPTFVINSEKEADVYYDRAVELGYDGVVYRDMSGLYEFGKRSYFMIKRKPRQTAEAFVYGVEIDRNSWGILHCKTIDTQIPFKCQMKVKAADINYREYKNALTLIGKTIEYSYEELSDAGVPTKPVGERIREVDEHGRPKQ